MVHPSDQPDPPDPVVAAARLRAQRLGAQLLSGPAAATAEDVVGHLLAVQAQDVRGFHLAVRARTAGLTAAAVADALAARRLVVSWLNRGTLHLVRAEDYPWLFALTTPQLAVGNARRLRQEGVSPEQAEDGVAAVEAALTASGPLVRAQLRDAVAAAGVPVAGQALVHVLMLTALRGLTVRGPMVGGEQAFVLVTDWMGPLPPVDRDAALAELGRRYLVGHHPATPEDLAAWAGIGLRDARQAMAAVEPPPVEEHPWPPPRLLGPFDPVLHGWPEREWVLGGHRSLVTSNGLFRPVVLVGGRAVGTWRMPARRVALELFEPVSATDRDALAGEAADVERFMAG